MLARERWIAMQAAREASLLLQPNSVGAIRARVREGKIPWAGPLLLLVTRPVMWMAAQSTVALLFLARHVLHPWHQACYWWSVCFTSADIVCLLAMRYFTRRERVRLRDLAGPIRMRHGHDVLLGLGFYLVAAVFFGAGGYFSQRLFYGSQQNPADFILHAHALPLWAVIYSLAIMWVVNAATEETTYQGYVLPRLEALTGHTWIAVCMVGFFFTLQHCALGFVPDFRSILCRFFGFLPGCVIVALLYVRTRRLAPLIVAHWLMDLGAVVMTTF